MSWNDREFRRTADCAAEIWARRLAGIHDADELDDAIEALLGACHEMAAETYPGLTTDAAAAAQFRQVVEAAQVSSRATGSEDRHVHGHADRWVGMTTCPATVESALLHAGLDPRPTVAVATRAVVVSAEDIRLVLTVGDEPAISMVLGAADALALASDLLNAARSRYGRAA